MAGLFQELKRRNVVRVGVAYIVVAWVVVQIAEVLFEAFGTPDWVIKTVIVLIGIGFPFVLIFAWAFEITPEGLKKTAEVNEATSITASTGRKLNFIIIAALVVALGYFIWERQSYDHGAGETVTVAAEETAEADAPVTEDESTSQSAQRSIAVLPFVNMSSDEEQEWFADGLTEEILNSLAKTPDLLVTARTSSFGYKGSTQPIPEIAAALGVDHVLEGSVRRGGEKLRITAQLIRAVDGFHLWSETFDRTMDDIIAIQEEIAIQIASALETAMDPEALQEMMSAGTTSVPAYEAYLNGVGLWQATVATDDVYVALDALDALQRSVEIDPEFARAWFRLFAFWSVETSSNQMLYDLVNLPLEEKLARRDEALENAIRFERDPPTRSFYLAYQAWQAYDVRRAVRFFSSYVEQRPNDAIAFASLLSAMRELGMTDEIVARIETMLDRDDLTMEKANQALQSLRSTERRELMRRLAYESVERYGDDDMSLLYQAHRQLLWASDIDGAANLLPRVQASDLPEDNRQLATLRQLCAEKRTDDANKLYDTMIAARPDDIGLKWLGSKILGEDARAEQLFVEFDERKDFNAITPYMVYPHFDPKVYPNLMKAYAGQGMETRPVLELPYRCTR